MTRGGGAAVSVQGGAGGELGAYEPAFSMPIMYDEIPDDAADNLLTLTGPMTVPEFLDTINIATNWNILVTEAAKAISLEFWLTEKTPKESLEILKFHEIFYEWDEETEYLLVMTNDEYLMREYGAVKPHEFQVIYADVPYIESFISTFLSTSGRVVTDQRTGRIYVWDTPYNIEQMEKVVDELDVPLEKREFYVEHTDLADIESVVTSMLSPNGSVLSDVRTGLVIVWDNPTALDQAEMAVAKLDVPVDSKTFEIKYIDAEDMIDSLEALLSERGMIQVDPRYNTIVVTDLPQKLTRMEQMVNILDRELDTRSWTIRYADLDFIADQIDTMVPAEMGEIVLSEDIHQIAVTGLPERLDKIDKLIKDWDIKRRQVYIEAFIVEASNEIEREFNVNWTYFNEIGNSPVAFTGGNGFDRADGPLNSSFPVNIGQLPYTTPLPGALQLDEGGNIIRPNVLNIDGESVIDTIRGTNLAVTLDYLDRKDKVTILSSPKVTVQDGEEAVFENATRVPFVSSTTTFSNSGFNANNNTNRVEFIDVGTILSVVPRITEDLNILLDISAEDSTFVPRTILSNGQPSTIPEKTVRRAETQLRIHTGETVVLGGLRRDRTAKNVTKTPILGDIPVVGRLFRYPSKEADNASLLIFITTTIVDEFSHPEARTLSAVDEEIAEFTRHNSKDFWGRMRDLVARGENELSVSVGPSGDVLSEGEHVTVEELREAFFEIKSHGIVIVLRRHPRAPSDVVLEIFEAAMEAGLTVEEDTDVVPLVPSYKYSDLTGTGAVAMPEPLPIPEEAITETE